MTGGQPHAGELLGPYALGVLEAAEARAVADHLATCAQCRAELGELSAMADTLGEVPPEAFLDGPPEDGELLLRRTLGAVRGEQARGRQRRVWLAAAGVAALAAAALGGGVVLGRHTAGRVSALPSPAVSATALPSGTRVIAASDPRTGAAASVTVIPAPGWVRLQAKITGVPAGLKCALLVVSKGGGPKAVAGSWVVSPNAERNGLVINGSAWVAPAQIASVDVVTLDGRTLVSVPD